MKIKIEDYMPIGMDVKKIGIKLAVIIGVPILYSLQFIQNFQQAKEVQEIMSNQEYTIYPMEDFVVILGNTLFLFPIGILACIMLAIMMYRYHTQDSKSLYVMKRLPNPYELWRRVGTIPALSAFFLVLIAVLLLMVYYLTYVNSSPVGSVQPHQWQKLIEVWLRGGWKL